MQVRFGRQRGRRRKRSWKKSLGRKPRVRAKAKAPRMLGRLESRRKRWVSRIWLDTVLAGEGKV